MIIHTWSEVLVAHFCLTLCNPIDCNVPRSSIHGISQARVLEWIAISFSRGSLWPRDRTQVFLIVQFSSVAQSCLTLCDPMDYSLLRSSVHGIFQARILEWVAISFSRGSSPPRDWTRVFLIVVRCFTSQMVKHLPTMLTHWKESYDQPRQHF